MRFRVILSILAVLCGMRSYAQSLASSQLVHADSLITTAVADSLVPGAVLCVVDSGRVVYLRAYGNRAIVPSCEPMTTKTIFDLASLSKPLGAGTAALLLIQQERLSADDKVNRYIPKFQTDATIRDLLTHRSGLPPYMNARLLDSIYTARHVPTLSRQDFLLDTICCCRRLSAPGEKYRYSCLNFITLQRVVESIVGEDLQSFLSSNLYASLQMDAMGWLPSDTLRARIAPTECNADGECLRGIVHDPLARIMMCGLSGNAGLFATAEDVATWSVWFMSLPDSVRRAACNAGLWSDEDDDVVVELRHTGYTGTSIALYPDYGRAVILLTNRVHPADRGNLSALRRQVNATFHPSAKRKE